MYTKRQKRIKRHHKIRTQISGTSSTPRLSVFRSNTHLMVQLIDDISGKTIASVTDASKKVNQKISKMDSAIKLGVEIAKKIQDLGIKKIVFDRGGFKYHGRVKALAEAVRSSHVEF